MRVKQPAALDVRAIFEAAHTAAEAPEWQEQWLGILSRAFGHDTWHTDQPSGGWCWHASALGSCPRQQILKRAGLATDGTRVESLNTMSIGTLYHCWGELGMLVLSIAPNAPYTNVATEIGGYHKELNLAARADLLYRHEGYPILVDYKTEGPYASTGRRKDAKARGDKCFAKPEHILQVTATAMVLESLGIAENITHGFVVYIEKSSGEIDQQLVAIDDEAREFVELGVRNLDHAWDVYSRDGVLPPRLSAGHWNCRQRSESDERGMYCSSRRSCMGAPPPP